MPLYTYKCKCGWTGDMHSSVDNRNDQKCPECGKKLKRVDCFTSTVIHIPPSMRAC
jgi:putative FmdB family regulatory protein